MAAGLGFALFFVALVFFERPGLGLGRFLFLPIVLLAPATDAWIGALGGLLTTCLDPRDALVRVGRDEFGVLTSLSSGEEAGRLAATLDQEGLDVTFGWAVAPQDGENALSLCQAADERRYARTLIRAARPHYSTA